MATPAPGMTGLAMLKAALEAEKYKPAPASTGCLTIDDSALQGGLRYGEITSIAGASGMGKTLITLQAAASHLLAHQTGEVAIIDTTGAFSPLRLRDVIAWRLSCLSRQTGYEHSGYIYEVIPPKRVEGNSALLDEVATRMLDRVKVMRVFDFVGVAEAVGEVGQLLRRGWNIVEEGLLQEHPRREKEVPSRQAIDNEDLSDDHVKVNNTSLIEGFGMVVIDNIANLVNSTMSISQVQGQALLMTFMRSLDHLTTRHQVCTLLINAAVGLSPSSNPTYQRGPEDNASVFTSTLGRPALGKMFAHLIDTSLFLSSIPKSKSDAERAYGGTGSSDVQWKSLNILEVLKDRHGSREGRWAAFDIVNGVELMG